jgi:hypothetical protein
VTGERVWAELLEDGLLRVDSIPWFITMLARGDLISAEERDGQLVATDKVEWSGNCTVRVIPLKDGPLKGSMAAVLDAFEELGVEGEGCEPWRIVAVSVPPTAPLAGVKDRLDRGQEDGSWEYEEGCIGEDWLDA